MGEERFGMVPARLARDGRLSAWDWRILLALLVLSRWDKQRQYLIPAKVRARTLVRMVDAQGDSGRRQVRRALRRLERLGYVKIMRRGGRSSAFDMNPTWDRSLVSAVLEDHGGDQLSLPQPARGGQICPGGEDKSVPPSPSKADNAVPPLLSYKTFHTGRSDCAPPTVEVDIPPAFAEAWDLARAARISPEGFRRALEYGPDLSPGEMAARVEGFRRSARGCKRPDLPFLRWIRKEADP